MDPYYANYARKLDQVISYAEEASGRVRDKQHWIYQVDQCWYVFKYGEAPLRRATWRMRLSMSTCTSTRPQASETRSPWRNINRTRQRSRTSFRLPRTASKRRSNSLPERCFRSFTVLSRVSPPGEPQNPCKQVVGFWTLDKMYPFVQSCRLEALRRSADGILVAATINL